MEWYARLMIAYFVSIPVFAGVFGAIGIEPDTAFIWPFFLIFKASFEITQFLMGVLGYA